MGQTSSQEIQDPPVSPVKKAPPRPQEPPKVEVEPIQRPPSYAIPENKVLPTELPARRLRAVSAGFVKSDPEFEKLFVDKENAPLENGSVNLDHNFFQEGQKLEENNDQNTEVVVLRNKEKYKAPSPPVANVYPVNSSGKQESNAVDPFYNRAALAHRRTHSLDRLSNNRGHPKRPASAINLTSSEHTIFEDPEEVSQNNKFTSLPQKSTFPMDYSYAVTYAQLAGHRRKNVQSKLETEKEILLKRQSLPDFEEKRNMDQGVGMYLIENGEIDLDNTTPPRRKKYRAPPPPSAGQVSKQSPVQQTPSKNTQISSPKKSVAPEEPPVDYDTGESGSSTMSYPKNSVETIATNGQAVRPPMTPDMKVIGLKNISAKDSSVEKMQIQTPSPKLIIQRQSSSFESTSPKSPPPVKPKPVRSPDEGRFRYPTTPVKVDTDIVTVNGQMIPEVKSHHPVQEVVSLSIDAKSETVRAAIVSPQATQSTPQIVKSPVESVEIRKSKSVDSPIGPSGPTVAPLANSVIPVSPNVTPVIPSNPTAAQNSPLVASPLPKLTQGTTMHPIQRENRETIYLGSSSKVEKNPDVIKHSTDKSLLDHHSVDNAVSNSVSPSVQIKTVVPAVPGKDVPVNAVPLSNDIVSPAKHVDGPVVNIEPIPLGVTADIVLETQSSSISESNPPTVPQSQSGSDSGVNMPLSDQSFESLTTGDRSMEMEGTVTVTDDEETTNTLTSHVTQGTMTVTPEIIEDRRETLLQTRSLDRSMSTSSSDSAKPVSPPLTPDDTQPPKMNSLLQNDIMAAAQTRVLKLKKPSSAPPPPKHPEEIFKEELAKLHKEREGRFKKSASVDAGQPQQSPLSQSDVIRDDISTDKDTDSGIQAGSFSEDWTPEHDLEDSDDEHRSAHTSRSGFFYDGRKGKVKNAKSSNSPSNAKARVLRKSDSDVSDKFGSLKRFRQNVHKSVKHALSSVNKNSSKPTKLDKRSSLPPPAPIQAEPQQPVFRKLDPDSQPQQPVFRKLDPEAAQQSPSLAKQEHISENSSSTSPAELMENLKEKEIVGQSDTDEKMMKKSGVTYVSGNGQMVLMGDVESPKSSEATPETEDGHRAPKRWKKVKKFAYMATTRKKEKQRMEQLLKNRVEEQERRMEEERQKQMEMELEFRKVRQVEKPVIKPEIDDTGAVPVRNGKGPKTKSKQERRHSEVNSSAVNESVQRHIAVNGIPQVNGAAQHISVNEPHTTVASFTMPGLVQAPNLITNGQPTVNPILLNGQAYNPYLAGQPIQNLAYPTAMGWGIPNYATMPQQYTASLPYDLTNYMQMLDINGQPVNLSVNNGLINSQSNGLIQYPGAHGFPTTNNVHLQQQQQQRVEANNYNNSRSLKHSIYVNPGPFDDSVLNQMYQNGNGNMGNGQDKNRSNPLYFSSDEEEEYDVSDIHTGHTHSKGAVARISVPAHSLHQTVQYVDEEMPSPSSATSSSGDSSTQSYPIKMNGSALHYHSVPSAHFRRGSASDAVNLDESYSSADR